MTRDSYNSGNSSPPIRTCGSAKRIQKVGLIKNTKTSHYHPSVSPPL